MQDVSDGMASNLQPADFDIKTQPANNYQYDKIGNMVRDKTMGESTSSTAKNIVWNNFGKIKSVTIPTSATVNKVLTYLYDATGNRVARFTKLSNSTMAQPSEQEYYIRDVLKTRQGTRRSFYIPNVNFWTSGNILSNIRRTNSVIGAYVYSDIVTTEQPIYGSSRLGVHNSGYLRANVLYSLVKDITPPIPNTLLEYRQQVRYRQMDNKRYELADHLGNTRAIFGDYLLANISTTAPYAFDDLHAHQTAMYNYYAFGSPKPNTYSTSINTITAQDQYYDDPTPPASMVGIDYKYRFGFNGQEKDNELKGTGNSLCFGYRVYDSRLGRFFSVDPLSRSYPWNGSYVFAENDVIRCIDIEGKEGYQIIDKQHHQTIIVVDLYYVDQKIKYNDINFFTQAQAEKVKKGLINEFSKEKRIDESNVYLNEKNELVPYEVVLQVNLHPCKTISESSAEVEKTRDDPFNSRILMNHIEQVVSETEDKITIVEGQAMYGSIEISDVKDSHMNMHELGHVLIHRHQNSSKENYNLINPDDQEGGHKNAGGIFIYENTSDPSNPVYSQPLNKQNIDDILNTLPVKSIINE